MQQKGVIAIIRNLKITGATLLSIEEAENLLTMEDRKYHCWWWLRSPGNLSDYAALVHRVGDVSYFGYGVYDVDYCVRPALQISNLQSSNLLIGDVFEVGDYKFKVISKDLAFLLVNFFAECQMMIAKSL